MAQSKKQNFIAAYFSNFGIRQICDFLMIGGAIMLIVGLATTQIVLTIGLGIYILASGLAVIRAVLVLCSKINHRAPAYKNAVVAVIVMSVVLALAIFGFVYSILF